MTANGQRHTGEGAWRYVLVGLALTAAATLATAGDRAEPPPAAASAAAGTGADLALQVLAYLGVPYRFGGEDPARGFDCSGLVRHAARAVLGLDLPRSSEAMARTGVGVQRADLQVGDLVFFDTRGRRYSHVGVYIGDARFVHAPARNGQVRIESMADGFWRQRYNGARRLHEAPVEPAPPAVAPDTAPIRERDGAPPEVHPSGGA